MGKQPDERYSAEEAQRRFMVTLKAAVNTPPKPLKDKPRKRPKKPTEAAGHKPTSDR
jgi:hypothetical protein